MCNLPCAHTPQVTRGVRGQDNGTGAPRVRGSNGRGFCLALPPRIPERQITSTGQSQHHKALIDSSPCTGAPARTPKQRMIGLCPDHLPATTSLLHMRRQQLVIATPLGADVATVRSVFCRKTLGPLQAPTWGITHPVPFAPPGRVDHHKLAH